MNLRVNRRLTFWQIYAICLAVDLAGRLLLYRQDIATLLAAPPLGWTLSDLLLVLMWLGFEAGWAFVMAFIFHSCFSRAGTVNDESKVNPAALSDPDSQDSSLR
jgi:hypothetical protein